MAQWRRTCLPMQETQVPGLGRSLRRKRQPTSVFLHGKSHRQRSLAGYNPWGHRAGHGTERAHTAILAVAGMVVILTVVVVATTRATMVRLAAVLTAAVGGPRGGQSLKQSSTPQSALVWRAEHGTKGKVVPATQAHRLPAVAWELLVQNKRQVKL